MYNLVVFQNEKIEIQIKIEWIDFFIYLYYFVVIVNFYVGILFEKLSGVNGLNACV